MRKFTLLMLLALLMPFYALADYNHAISFTTASTGSVGDRLIVPLSAVSTDNPYTGDLSVNLWFLQEQQSNSGGVVMAYTTQTHDNDNGAVVLFSQSAGLKWAGWGKDQRLEANTATTKTASVNEWHNLTLVVDQTSKVAKVYLDGELVLNHPFKSTVDQFLFSKTFPDEKDGAFTFGGFNFKGSYDEISFYNRALTEEEITEAYTTAVPTEGLTARYDFQNIIEGTTGQFANVAGNDNATVATYTTNRGGTWGGGVISITSESEGSAVIDHITAETCRGGQQAEETHTLTLTTAGEGEVTISDGENTYASGDAIPADADLTLTFAPAEGWTLASAVFADGDFAGMDLVELEQVENGTFQLGNLTTDLTLNVTFEQIPPAPRAEYCYAEGTTSSARGVNTLVASDNEEHSVSIQGAGTSGSRDMYLDKTETVLVTSAGAEITLQTSGAGEWMSNYIYVDFNNNGVFDLDPDKCEGANVDGDLVYHTGFNKTKMKPDNSDFADPEYNSDGTPCNWGSAYSRTMKFTLPESMAAGDYRIRLKIDWNDVDPCGRTAGNGYNSNLMNNNGGVMIDFTLRIEAIEPREVSVKSNDEALGTAAIVAPEASSSTITTDQPVMVKATKVDDDAYFVNWTDAEGNVMSEDLEYTYSGKEAIELTANFRQHYMLTIVDSEEGTTVKAGTEVVASGDYVDKGTRLTVICEVEGKILKSLMVNEVEKVEEYVGTGYTFTMNEATAIEVEYALPVYEVGQLAVEGEGTLVVAEGVTAEGAPSGATFAEGAELEKGSEPVVIATPAAHYKVESMIVDGFAVVTDGKPLEEDEYVSTYAEGLIVAYKAYVEGSLNASVKFVHDGSAIESIGADEAGDAEFFNLQGIRVVRENLVPGIYIMRNAEGARKVSVK